MGGGGERAGACVGAPPPTPLPRLWPRPSTGAAVGGGGDDEAALARPAAARGRRCR